MMTMSTKMTTMTLIIGTNKGLCCCTQLPFFTDFSLDDYDHDSDHDIDNDHDYDDYDESAHDEKNDDLK